MLAQGQHPSHSPLREGGCFNWTADGTTPGALRIPCWDSLPEGLMCVLETLQCCGQLLRIPIPGSFHMQGVYLKLCVLLMLTWLDLPLRFSKASPCFYLGVDGHLYCLRISGAEFLFVCAFLLLSSFRCSDFRVSKVLTD